MDNNSTVCKSRSKELLKSGKFNSNKILVCTYMFCYKIAHSCKLVRLKIWNILALPILSLNKIRVALIKYFNLPVSHDIINTVNICYPSMTKRYLSVFLYIYIVRCSLNINSSVSLSLRLSHLWWCPVSIDLLTAVNK